MKAIRQARRKRELGDVKLSGSTGEAVEQYVAAEPQQRLLEKRKEPRAAKRENQAYADC